MKTLPTKIDHLRNDIDAEFEKIYNLTFDGTLYWEAETSSKFVLQRPCDIESDIFPSITLYPGTPKRNVTINGTVVYVTQSLVDSICDAAKEQSEACSIRSDLTNSLVSLREFTEVFERNEHEGTERRNEISELPRGSTILTVQ